jgi:RES domain
MRIHHRYRKPLWFGPGSGIQAIHRFDDPEGQFGVCYFGTNPAVCFAETFLRNPPVRILALDDLADRSISTVELRRALRLVSIYGSGLARLGVTTELASGSNYAASQQWSRALQEHKDNPDGILYRARHDDSALCVALYDRAQDALAEVESHSLTEDPQYLARLLKKYSVGLTH